MLTDNLPKVIPPKTIVKLVRYDYNTPGWKDEVGNVYCIGYYRKQDGLDSLWLVDTDGKYCQTTDKDYLLKFFEILKLGDTTDYYGDNSPSISGITKIEPYSVLEEVPSKQS